MIKIDDAVVYYDVIIKRERPGNCFRDFLEMISTRKLSCV